MTYLSKAFATFLPRYNRGVLCHLLHRVCLLLRRLLLLALLLRLLFFLLTLLYKFLSLLLRRFTLFDEGIQIFVIDDPAAFAIGHGDEETLCLWVKRRCIQAASIDFGSLTVIYFEGVN